MQAEQLLDFTAAETKMKIWHQYNRFKSPVGFITYRSKAVVLELFVLCWLLWLIEARLDCFVLFVILFFMVDPVWHCDHLSEEEALLFICL